MTSLPAFRPGPAPNTVVAADGKVHQVPEDWSLLPPGDAGLTRRVKAAGPHWIVEEKRGRRTFSGGVWAPEVIIQRMRSQLEAERSTPEFTKRRAAATRKRERTQAQYVEDFHAAVCTFLRFHPRHADLAEELAQAVTQHATPVGSGTVARTQRIPVERRAEAAVIAWMRHQTTGYDDMKIPRVKGRRREVRRLLAQRSQELLEGYRRGDPPLRECPLAQSLRSNPPPNAGAS